MKFEVRENESKKLSLFDLNNGDLFRLAKNKENLYLKVKDGTKSLCINIETGESAYFDFFNARAIAVEKYNGTIYFNDSLFTNKK